MKDGGQEFYGPSRPRDDKRTGPSGRQSDGGQSREQGFGDRSGRSQGPGPRDQGPREFRGGRGNGRSNGRPQGGADRGGNRQGGRRDYPVVDNPTGVIDPFELFCAYHLGITRDDGYRATDTVDVARRFGVTPEAIKQALVDFNMDPETVLNCDFDLSMAQLDIQVSPPGVSKTELARSLYEEFLAATRSTDDWNEPMLEEVEVAAHANGLE